MLIKTRKINQKLKKALIKKGVESNLASIICTRNITSADKIDYDLKNLIAPDYLLNITKAAEFLYDCIESEKKKLL
jgi:hypothetical protein